MLSYKLEPWDQTFVKFDQKCKNGSAKIKVLFPAKGAIEGYRNHSSRHVSVWLFVRPSHFWGFRTVTKRQPDQTEFKFGGWSYCGILLGDVDLVTPAEICAFDVLWFYQQFPRICTHLYWTQIWWINSLCVSPAIINFWPNSAEFPHFSASWLVEYFSLHLQKNLWSD